MEVDDGTVSLDIDKETRSSAVGAYSIVTGSDFQIPNNRYLLGLGKPDKYGIVSPVATVNLPTSIPQYLTATN